MARTTITARIEEPRPQRFDAAGFSLGTAVFASGGMPTASVGLAPIGIPAILVSLPLVPEPNRRRNPDCA